jgi:FkbM family methyltransferase
MRAGRRNLRQLRQLILEPSVYLAMPRLFTVHHSPFRVIFDEVFSLATYPRTLVLRTPTGDVNAKLYSSEDLSTTNLVFCRGDYLFPTDTRIVVDIGANIGLSSLYWLSRNPETFVECYEPAPRTFQRLLDNLAPYAGRFAAYELAVSDFRGHATLGIDPSGVNASLDVRKRAVEFANVEIININDVLENTLRRHGRIDLLKLDNEGHEYRTLSAIAPELWDEIACVNVGCHDNAGAVPAGYTMTRIGSAERFVRRSSSRAPVPAL